MSQISGVVSDEREQTKINKWTSHGRFFYSMLKSWTIKYLSDYQLFFTEILIDFSITLFFFFIQQNLNIPTLCVRQPNLALFRVIYRFFFFTRTISVGEVWMTQLKSCILYISNVESAIFGLYSTEKFLFSFPLEFFPPSSERLGIEQSKMVLTKT